MDLESIQCLFQTSVASLEQSRHFPLPEKLPNSAVILLGFHVSVNLVQGPTAESSVTSQG
jgi:hypothetical protein